MGNCADKNEPTIHTLPHRSPCESLAIVNVVAEEGRKISDEC